MQDHGADLGGGSVAPPMCRAPFTTMHLDPRGTARVCCENRLFEVGRVPGQTLGEIWHGERMSQLRAAVAAGRFDLGCEGCRVGIVSGPRARARAVLYDGLEFDGSSPAHPIRLELELTNTCNLQCVMCNGELSSAIRARREGRPPLPPVYDDEFFEQLAAWAPLLAEVSFQGGEPFLGRESMRAFDVLRRHGFRGRCHVTTNGTVVNRRVEQLLDELRVDVSVSIDGATAATVEAIRVGASFDTVMENLDWFRAKAVERGTSVGVHFCLMPANVHELRGFLLLADRRDLDVTVIDVVRPLSMSIERLDEDELVRIAALFDEQDVHSEPLGRNRPRWERVRSDLERWRGGPAGTTVALGRAVPSGDPRRRAAADMASWADERGVHVLELDVAERIVDVAPDAGDALGMDLSEVVGASVRELFPVVCERFGVFAGSEVVGSPSGTEDRRLQFDAPGGVTTVRSLLVNDPGSESATLFLAVRSGAHD